MVYFGEDMLVRYLTTLSCNELWSSSADFESSAGSVDMRPRSSRNCSSRDLFEGLGLMARGSSIVTGVGVDSPMETSEKRLGSCCFVTGMLTGSAEGETGHEHGAERTMWSGLCLLGWGA